MSGTSTVDAPEMREQAELIKDFLSLARSLWVSRSIYVAAELGLADLIANGPTNATSVAEAIGAEPTAVVRLMRALVTIGMLTQTDAGTFGLTPMGGLLRSDAAASLRNAVLMGGSDLRAWGELTSCVRTGHTAAKLLDDIDDPFQGSLAQPDAHAVFNRAMAEGTRVMADAIVAAYGFSGVRTIVDVGGGHGALLPPILRAHSEMTATVFDLARCEEGATQVFEKTGLAARCQFVSGDFFSDPLPAGADAYVLKSVIHDWDDKRSLSILRGCRAAMGNGSRLLVIEIVVPDRLDRSPEDQRVTMADLTMLVFTGGRERTEAEYRRLLNDASFAVTRIVPTLAGFSVIEAASI